MGDHWGKPLKLGYFNHMGKVTHGLLGPGALIDPQVLAKVSLGSLLSYR